MPKGYLSLLTFLHHIPKFGHCIIPSLKQHRFFIRFPGIDRSKQNLFAQGAHCKILIKCFGNTSCLLMFPVILGQFILRNIKPICSCFLGSLIFPMNPANCSPNVLHATACPICGWQLNCFFRSAEVSCGRWGLCKPQDLTANTPDKKTLPVSLANVYQHSLKPVPCDNLLQKVLVLCSWLKG